MEHIEITIKGNSDEIRNSLHGLINSPTARDVLGLPSNSIELSYAMVASETGGSDYKLTKLGQMTVACTCPDFQFRRDNCKHMRRANGGT
jgi:hypothetical protein